MNKFDYENSIGDMMNSTKASTSNMSGQICKGDEDAKDDDRHMSKRVLMNFPLTRPHLIAIR